MFDKRSQEFLDELLLRLSVLEFKEIKSLKHLLQENTDLVKELIHLLRHRPKHRLHLFFIQGDTIVASSVSVVLSPTASVPATIVETAPDGSVFNYDPNNIQYSVEDPTVVSFTKNADGSVVFTPLKVGTSNVGVADTSNGSSDTGLITVTQGNTGQFKLAMTFGTPTP